MSEEKQVLYDLRTTYSGPFSVEDFYAEVDRWIKDSGFEKEPKKKLEHITKDGKKIEWIIEIHSHLDELHHGAIQLRVLMDNVKEVSIKKGSKKIRINKGDVMVNINGFIISHLHASFWQLKPIYYFIRTLIDKYIWNFWSFKWDGTVNGQCRELFKVIRSFFEVQKYKYG